MPQKRLPIVVEDVSEYAPAPRYRWECVMGERPCPYVSCRHHLYLDVNPTTGNIKINYPDRPPWELDHSCSLDVAQADGLTLEEVGAILNLTRERIRQIEVFAIRRMRKLGALGDIEDD